MVLKTHKTKGLVPMIFQKKVKQSVKNVTKTGTASLFHRTQKQASNWLISQMARAIA